MLKQGFKEDRCESGIWASLNGRTLEILSSVHFRIICSDPVLAGVPSPEVLCSLGFLGWLGETFHEEMVGGTVCSRWAKTMIVSVVPFYDLQDLMQKYEKNTEKNRRFKCILYKTNKKYYGISTIYECVEKLWVIIS